MRINGINFNGDHSIEHQQNGSKTLRFTINKNDSAFFACKAQAKVVTSNIYRIQMLDHNGKYIDCECSLDLSDFEKEIILDKEYKSKTVKSILDDIKMDWTINVEETMQDKFDLKVKNATYLDVIRQLQKLAKFNIEFNNVTKTIDVYTNKAYRGLYITDQLNIINDEYQADTYKFCTRLYAYGKNDITFASVNNGKTYIDDNQHSEQIISRVINFSQVTDPSELLEKAKEELSKLSKPKESYKFKIFNLSKIDKNDFSLKNIGINDVVKYIDRERKTSSFHKVVKYIEHPNDPSKDEITLSSIEESSISNLIANASVIRELNSANDTVYQKSVEYTDSKLNELTQNGTIILKKNELLILDNKENPQNVFKIDNKGLQQGNSVDGPFHLLIPINQNKLTLGYTGILVVNNKQWRFENGVLMEVI